MTSGVTGDVSDETTGETSSAKSSISTHRATTNGRFQITRLRVLVGILLLFGVVMRIWVLASPFGLADADESVVGLMAQAFLDGDPSAFYWGQAYGGSQEAMVVAAVFAVTGESVLGLKLVAVTMSIVATHLLWRLGRRVVGDTAAAVGAAVFWSVPLQFVWMTTKERGFYEATMIFGLATILCVVRLAQRPSYRVSLVGGLCAGLAVWASPQCVYLLFPAVLWLLVRRWRVVTVAWSAVPTFLVGLAPSLYFNLQTDWSSLHLPAMGTESTYVERLEGFFKVGLPILFGAKVPYRSDWTLPVVGIAVYAIGVGLVLWAAFRVLRTVRSPEARSGRRPVEILVLCVVSYPFLFALSPFSIYIHEPRYLYFMWAPMALLLSWVLVKHRFIGVVGIAAAAVLTVISMASLLDWDQRWSNHDLTTDDLGAVTTSLERNGDDSVFADYWVAYRITLASDEKITASPITGIRRAEIEAQVNSDPDPSTYVVFTGSDTDQQMQRVLGTHAMAADVEQAGHFTIYRLDQRLLPQQFQSAAA